MFKRFQNDQAGTITVEFAIVVPLLITLMVMSFEVFDAFKSYGRASKATAAVTDIISRQTTIDQQFVTELHEVMDAMMPWLNEDKTMRVTTFSWDKSKGYEVVWSYTSGNTQKWTNEMLTSGLGDMLPPIASGDTVVLTEVEIPHRSLVRWMGLDDLVWSIDQTTRPRFVTCITDTDDACGDLNKGDNATAAATSTDPSAG